MRLAVPITAPAEILPLYSAGATEFYCGLQDSAWSRLFGNHDSISRRQGAGNLDSTKPLSRW